MFACRLGMERKTGRSAFLASSNCVFPKITFWEIEVASFKGIVGGFNKNCATWVYYACDLLQSSRKQSFMKLLHFYLNSILIILSNL
jgi:hypothetical protein